jgi:PleD family two-component response regulator
MEGQIGVESEPGLGAKFWFTVVVDVEAPPAASPFSAAADACAAPGAGMRVLVAEDNEINQEYVGVVLRGAGCDVMMVDDGQGAVDACLAAGMDDYLTKPFKPVDLLAMLRRWSLAASPTRA